MAIMARRWRQVEFELVDQAELFARRIADDNLSPAKLREAQYMRQRSQALLKLARVEFDKYKDFAGTLIEGRQNEMARAGIDLAGRAIRAIGIEAGVRINFDILPVRAVENMIGLAGDGSPLTTLLESSFGAGVDGMFSELIKATAIGRNPRETAQIMVRDGFSQSLNRMLNIARTEQLRVYRESSRMAYQASGVVGSYRRLATRDARTCVGCLMSDGQEYQLDQPLDEHPQGRCTLIPNVNGLPPVNWTKGPDWFLQQSPATQRSIMGPGKYDAWQAGQFNLDQLVSVRRNDTWGDSVQPTPLRDLVGN